MNPLRSSAHPGRQRRRRYASKPPLTAEYITINCYGKSQDYLMGARCDYFAMIVWPKLLDGPVDEVRSSALGSQSG